MTLRFHRAVVLATALACGPAMQAHAQDVDLRTLDAGGGFPTSPTAAPDPFPEDTSPPALNPSSTAADQTSPRSATDETPQDPGAPNYGKARKKKPKLYRPDPKGSPPLSPLVPYRGAAGPQHRALNPAPPPPDGGDAKEPGPTFAAIPSYPRPKSPVVEPDAFAPTGVQVGELRLLPFVETSAGYETNPNQVVTGAKSSPALRVDGGLDVQSDFPTNSLTASLRGGYSEFPSNSNANRPDLSANVVGHIDVTRDDQIDIETRFALSTQTPGSPLLANPTSVFITDRPVIMSEGATLGETHTFNRLAIGLRGTVDRTSYGDATQSDGTIYRYSQDNYNDYGIIGRASYEVTPAVIPFVEVGADERVRDTPIDLSGYYRDSVGGFARAGTTLELGRLLTGTASAGYLDRHYDDARLPNLRGPTLDAALVYAATPLTTVTVRASTTASETTLAGASGAISRQFSLEVGHTFFRNFTLTGIVTYQPNEYQGVSVDEHFMQYTLKGAYSFTRDVQLIASASRQTLTSTLASDNFTDNIFLVGVRLQR